MIILENLGSTSIAARISVILIFYSCFQQDQKLQLHLMAKEEHHRKLNEVEKCYATITCQFGMIKGAHEKLEQNGKYALNIACQ